MVKNLDINSSFFPRIVSSIHNNRDNLVVSIHGKNITKDDLPQEYNTLDDTQKRRFLSRYIYLRVALDTLENEKERYKKDIKEAIEKEKSKLDKMGIILSPLEKLILEQDITFKTVAFNEVLKYHKNIDKEIEKYYIENEHKFNYPDRFEVSHISIKSKNKAEKILKELLEKNASIRDFAKYARVYSKDYKTAIRGGYVGEVGKNEIGKEFFKEMWDSNISYGVYTKLLKGKKNYYHIIYILNRTKAEKKTLKRKRII